MTVDGVRGAAGTGDETAKILADARTAINTTRANWPNPMIWIPSALDRLFAFAESVARDRARQEAENKRLTEELARFTKGTEGFWYECPKCYRFAPWTDGVSDDDNEAEFWCQTCGAESLLTICRKLPVVDLSDSHPLVSSELRADLVAALARVEGLEKENEALAQAVSDGANLLYGVWRGTIASPSADVGSFLDQYQKHPSQIIETLRLRLILDAPLPSVDGTGDKK